MATAPTEAPSAAPATAAAASRSGPVEIALDRLEPNPFQPRRNFDASSLEELEISVRRHGVLQPIVVRPGGDRGYQIVAGERRWRSAGRAGLTSIPAVIRTDLSDEGLLEIALVENVQRRDLNPIEKAAGYREMMERLGLTQAQVAARVGLKRASVTNHLRLLDLPEKAQRAVVEGLVSMGHARALLAIKQEREQLRLVEKIAREGWSVRQVETFVRGRTGGTGGGTSKPGTERSTRDRGAPWQDELGRRLRERLGTKVTIQNSGGADGEGYRGQIVIDYFSREDLDRVVELIAPASRV